MTRRVYAVYQHGLPNEIVQLLGLKLNSLLSFGPTIKIRVRQGIHPGEHGQEQHTMEIFPLLGPKLNLMGLDIKPSIEIVLGDD